MTEDEWNAAHEVGTTVVLQLDNGMQLLATTGGLARPAGELATVPLAPSGALWPVTKLRPARVGDVHLGWFS